jgi:hypothetical protein
VAIITLIVMMDSSALFIDASGPCPTGVEVHRYYEMDEHRRLDVVVLDEDGEIVVTVEVERINHDVKRAVPDDYDKMADCNPEEALWVVMTHSAAHDVLAALNDPPDGEPRVEKTYAPNDAGLAVQARFPWMYGDLPGRVASR